MAFNYIQRLMLKTLWTVLYYSNGFDSNLLSVKLKLFSHDTVQQLLLLPLLSLQHTTSIIQNWFRSWTLYNSILILTYLVQVRFSQNGSKPLPKFTSKTLKNAHIAKIKIDQNRKMHLQILDILCKNVRQNCRDLKKKFHDVLFLKSRLIKWRPLKQTKSKNRHHFW